MRNEGLIKSFVPEADIAGYRVVKFGTTDALVAQASAAADNTIGVSNMIGAVAADDDTVDIVMSGIAEIEYGGTITRGAKLTCDANGKAIAAATTNSVIGIAMVSGVAGDIGSLLIQQSKLP